MTARVKLATTATELRDLFRVRHQVYVDEGGFLPDQGGTIADMFDSLPTTTNLIAVAEGDVAGGVRITLASEAGLPSDSAFDFRPHLPDGARPATCSMLCMRRANRQHARLLVGLFRMTIYWASAQGVTHICGPINPQIASTVARMGFHPVAEPFTDSKGLPTLPTVLDMASLAPDFKEFIERQDLGMWMDSFERAFFEPGDVIVHEGDEGDEAYLVVLGRAAAVAQGAGTDGLEVAEFRRGSIFGELALLTNRGRTSTVVATEPTDVMVLRRDHFQQQVASRPDLALSLMQSIGDRFHAAVTQRR